MNLINKTENISVNQSIGDVIDDACKKLKEKQVQYSIKKICELKASLTCLEEELEHIIKLKEVIK
jgi:uncharacterized protein YqgV (UPF0045/DUF77 family)